MSIEISGIININEDFNLLISHNGKNDKLIDDYNKKLKLFGNLLNYCCEKLKYTNDEDYTKLEEELNKKLEFIEQKHTMELAYKDRDNEVKENEYKNRILTEKYEIENKYITQINEQNNEIIKLKDEIKYNNNNKNINEILDERFNKFDKYFDDKLSIQQKGEIGEDYLFNYIKKIMEMSNGIIEKVKGESNAGDLYLEYDNMRCCIESKNHVGNIPCKEINRFLYTDVQHTRYNCGLFISLKSEFVNSINIKHFDIQIENNKPCIFLCNIDDNISDIKSAIKILRFLVNNKNDINKNIDYVNQINKDLKIYKEIDNSINNDIKNLNKRKKIIKERCSEINELLNIESIEDKKIKFKCSLCPKEYKSSSALIKHQKTCM